MHCNAPQHTAMVWKPSQHLRNVPQHTARHPNGLQAFPNVSAMHGNALQHTTVCLSVGPHLASWQNS